MTTVQNRQLDVDHTGLWQAIEYKEQKRAEKIDRVRYRGTPVHRCLGKDRRD